MRVFLNSEAIKYLEGYNKDFEKQHGYIFCRCFSCFLPILLEIYIKFKLDEFLYDKLSNAVQAINDDYLYSADFKMGVRSRSGLKCGYDCVHYENVLEACPLIFWEINKSNLYLLLELLDKLISFGMVEIT